MHSKFRTATRWRPTQPVSPIRTLLFPALLLGAGGLAQAQLPDPVADVVDNETGRSVGDAIVETCPTGANGESGIPESVQFQADCDAIAAEFGSDPDVAADAINQVAADQVSAQNAAAARQFRTNVAAVSGRLARIRVAALQPGAEDGLALAQWGGLDRAVGGGAGGDASFGRLGGFFNVKYRWGDEDATRSQPGFDFDGWAGVAGLDYRFSDNAVGGVAINYMSDEADYDDSRGDLESDGWGVSGYGTLYLENGLFVDGMLGYNSVDYDLDRRLVYSSGGQNVNQTATSSADGDMISASLGAGFTIARGATTYTPSARLDYVENDVDGFTERMSNPTADGGGMAVSIDDATYTSLTSRLGLQVSHAVSHAGGVVVPSVQFDWVHEFDNDREKIDGRFVNDVNSAPFFIFTNDPDRDYFDLQLAVSAQFAGGVAAFFSYNTLLGFSDLNYNAVNAGVRMEF